ncbi:hypothetical protein GCM10025791_21890 [Halioxenophilus aromaticivorans]|uniref:Uncharacterized protein n=2 Tax=Halioxenophilus aromaticivorans TaxID=1306992 RepID=A0AAV3U2F0_9ALTE
MAAADISAFSKIPSVRSMSISPNGRYYAWLQQENDENLIVVYDTQKDATTVKRTGDKIKNRSINFATNEYVVLPASSTQRFYSRLNPLEYSGAFSFNLATGEVKRLLLGTQDLYLSQTGLGRIIGVNEDDASVFMPAWDNKSTPRYNLYKVSLETGRGVLTAPGSWRTTDWFVSAQGDVLAREDFDHEKNEYALYSYSDGKAEKIFTQKTHLPEISSEALSQDEKTLLLADTSQNLTQVLAIELSSGKQHQWPIANQQEDIDHGRQSQTHRCKIRWIPAQLSVYRKTSAVIG